MDNLNSWSVEQAEEHLSNVCDVMRQLIIRFGHCDVFTYQVDPFESLVHSIVGQQLSKKAAKSIESKIVSLCGDISVDSINRRSIDELRTAGLSKSKATYIWNLSSLVLNGKVDLNSLYDKTDKQVVDELLPIPGIGNWTIQMFLIFCLKHPNVLPVNDAGLKRSFQKLFPANITMEKQGKEWSPYCSVASWYLWKFIDQ